MAPTVEEIAKTLDIIKQEGELKAEKFDKILTDIKEKLEFMNSDNESVDLIKLYLTELKNLVNSDFNNTEEKFESVENKIDVSIDISTHIKELSENLREYITELDEASRTLETDNTNNISEKLVDLEEVMTHSSENYAQNLQVLESKISEFNENIEAVKNISENKISESLGEINDVKAELVNLQESLINVKTFADEKSVLSIQAVEDGIERIIAEIIQVSDRSSKENNMSLNNQLNKIEEDFDVLLSSVVDLKNDFVEKLTNLKQEVELINTDIVDALQNKSNNILQAFEPLKISIDNLREFGFNDILEKIKLEIETSFLNFSVDVNGELSSASEAVLRLEQAYKEIFNKIEVIENCVSEKLHEKLELVNATIENNAHDVKGFFEQKLEEYSKNLSEIIEENDVKVVNSVENLNNEITARLDNFDEVQKNIKEQNNEISAGISTLGNDLKNYVQSACENTIEKYSPIESKTSIEALRDKINEFVAMSKIDVANSQFAIDELNQKLDTNLTEISDSNQDVSQMISSLHDKMDVMVADSSFDELNNRLDKFSDTENDISEMLSTLHNKIDIIAETSSTNELTDKIDSFSEKENEISEILSTLHNKIDIIAETSNIDGLQFDDGILKTQSKVSEMLSALNEKVDIIAMDTSDLDIVDEISDIKELIFEQSKYFESASDEKAVEIDKYLKDVLAKLENVDLEKNSEDIKESIMNALVSLVDQISFVEETEEIKDFVEEKTDIINKNLLEVQNQLKQIASSNDDFDYSYTLQDVESDIAKLRLAITHISGNDYEGLSNDIKKIVTSVEGLENSLTQDQVVDLKNDIEKLNEDILSISSRTNKLLLSSDESYKALSEGLSNFSKLVAKLDDRINYFDNSKLTERLERKIDNIQSMSTESLNADKVFHQVMMYLGEWIDSSTESISSISEKTSEISNIKEEIEELKSLVPEKVELLNELENKFEEQETRIDRLEIKLDKILSTLEEKDDMVLNRKVDKLEKMLSRLGNNIEKLTSYVDED